MKNTLGLAAFLWLITLVVFFPIAGWGFLGLNITATLILPVTITHLLFAMLLWGLARLVFGRVVDRPDAQPRTI